MPWGVKDVCKDVICGGSLGIVRGIFGISFFTESETEEIMSLRQLAISIMEKSSKPITDPSVCDGIREGKQSALKSFTKGASPETVNSGLVAAAELVCNKSFKLRFREVLVGACLNLVGC